MYVLSLAHTCTRISAYIVAFIFTYIYIFPLSVGGERWNKRKECEIGRVGVRKELLHLWWFLLLLILPMFLITKMMRRGMRFSLCFGDVFGLNWDRYLFSCRHLDIISEFWFNVYFVKIGDYRYFFKRNYYFHICIYFYKLCSYHSLELPPYLFTIPL